MTAGIAAHGRIAANHMNRIGTAVITGIPVFTGCNEALDLRCNLGTVDQRCFYGAADIGVMQRANQIDLPG